MTAPDPRLDDIQARLDAATPGPWAVEDDDGFGHKVYKPGGWGTMYICEGLQQGHDDGLHDATFIANTPADVAYLLAELRKAHEALAAAWDEGAQAEADTTMLTEDEEAAGEHAATFVCPSRNPYRAAVAAANGDGQ